MTTIPAREPQPESPPAGSGSTPGLFREGQTPVAPAKNSKNQKSDFLFAVTVEAFTFVGLDDGADPGVAVVLLG